MLQRIAVLSLVGMMVGSAANASDNSNDHKRHRKEVEFSCLFEGYNKGESACRAWGRFELRREHHEGDHPPGTTDNHDGNHDFWRSHEGEMKIICADGKAGERDIYFGPVRAEMRDFDDNENGDHDRNSCEDIRLVGHGFGEPRIEIESFDHEHMSGFRRAELSLGGFDGGFGGGFGGGIHDGGLGKGNHHLRLHGGCEFRHREFDDLL